MDHESDTTELQNSEKNGSTSDGAIAVDLKQQSAQKQSVSYATVQTE